MNNLSKAVVSYLGGLTPPVIALPILDFVVVNNAGFQKITRWAVKDASGNAIAQPTADQLAAADAIASLATAKTVKITTLSTTLTDPVVADGIQIATDDATKAAFDQALGILTLAERYAPDNAAFLAQNVSSQIGPIIDAAGNQHDMTVAQFYTLVLDYGMVYGQARAALQSKIAAVNAATTIDAVNAIV